MKLKRITAILIAALAMSFTAMGVSAESTDNDNVDLTEPENTQIEIAEDTDNLVDITPTETSATVAVAGVSTTPGTGNMGVLPIALGTVALLITGTGIALKLKK